MTMSGDVGRVELERVIGDVAIAEERALERPSCGRLATADVVAAGRETVDRELTFRVDAADTGVIHVAVERFHENRNARELVWRWLLGVAVEFDPTADFDARPQQYVHARDVGVTDGNRERSPERWLGWDRGQLWVRVNDPVIIMLGPTAIAVGAAEGVRGLGT